MTTDMPVSLRAYSAEEVKAMRRAGIHAGGLDRGPMYFACGPYWADELERRARAHREQADAEELCAAALRREQERWPEPDSPASDERTSDDD